MRGITPLERTITDRGAAARAGDHRRLGPRRLRSDRAAAEVERWVPITLGAAGGALTLLLLLDLLRRS